MTGILATGGLALVLAVVIQRQRVLRRQLRRLGRAQKVHAHLVSIVARRHVHEVGVQEAHEPVNTGRPLLLDRESAPRPPVDRRGRP